MKTTIEEVGRYLPTSITSIIPMAIKLRDPSETCWLFQNGNYWILFLKDGTKVRFNDQNSLIPDHPECIDLTISTYCKNNCPFCYMSCSSNGRMVDPYSRDLDKLLEEIPAGTELAINCNSLDYTTLNLFTKFLEKINKENKFFINVTIHENDFITHHETLQEFQKLEYIHGIGVSISNRSKFNDQVAIDNQIHYLNLLANIINGMDNIVLHIIPKLVDFDIVGKVLIQRLHSPKLLMLGYKEMGRGLDLLSEEEIRNQSIRLDVWKDIVYKLYTNKFPSKLVLSFDGLALKEFNIRNMVSEDEFNILYAGNEGAYSMYIDLPNRKYARSSLETEHFDWGNKTIKEMFESIRTPALGQEGGIYGE